VLARSGAKGRAPALVRRGLVSSYAELNDRVDARRDALFAEGRSSGEVVPFVAEPSVASVVELLALWRVGAIPVPLHARLTESERVAAKGAVELGTLPSETFVVLWTSGTSGRPRGVALSFANLEASARAARDRLGLGSSDVWVASLSPAHVGGLALVVRSILLGGALVVPDEPGIEAIADLLDRAPGSDATRHRGAPTHLSLVPTQLMRLLDAYGEQAPPSSLRCVLVGGAHAPAALVQRAIDRGWPIALTYGATEMSSQIATAPPELTRSVPGTVGPPLPGVDLRVDAAGEIAARGATRALGYVGPDAGPLADEDGWYRTGDLGRIDAEGRLWVTGRRIDRIVTGGVTVDAVEVEEALRAHPTVIDACVVGIPDEEWGERVGAWVEPVVGEFDLEELERHLRETLSPAKLPRTWQLDGEIPRNPNGKVDRAAVRRVLDR